MSDIAIRVEGLGKRYRIGERDRYKALRDVITDGVASPFRRLRAAVSANRQAKGHIGNDSASRLPLTAGNDASASRLPLPAGNDASASRLPLTGGNCNGSRGSSPTAREGSVVPSDSPDIWALKDVSFEVKRGEVVGIIGRNGAGKSTLLKILSRITAPTEGEVEIKGRVGSLLEVGTGFHPELTGRENIYLNGAILGMNRAEINRKFNEMVAFAEIKKFIDTPVKRYSSGMYVRLAFAVAAHLDPEILVIDEVLAVGDTNFQKKCIARISEVSTSQRSTVLIVSHNQTIIRSLCSSALLLKEGRICALGQVASVCDHYQSQLSQNREWKRTHYLSEKPHFLDIRVCRDTGEPSTNFEFGEPFKICFRAQLPPVRSFITLIIKSATGGSVAEIYDVNFNPSAATSRQVVEARVPRPNLLPGDYTLDAWLGEGLHERIERLNDCCSFTVVAGADLNLNKQIALGPSGVVFLESSWSSVAV